MCRGKQLSIEFCEKYGGTTPSGKIFPKKYNSLRLCNAAEKSIWSMVKLDSRAIKRVKAHTLTNVPTNNIQKRFTFVSHATEWIKTIIDRYALIGIKYGTSKLVPKQDKC